MTAELPAEEKDLPPPEFRLNNKSDLGTSDADATHHVSALTGDGIDGFIDDLSAFLQENYAKTGSAVLTRQRHQQILREVRQCSPAPLMQKAGAGIGGRRLAVGRARLGAVTRRCRC